MNLSHPALQENYLKFMIVERLKDIRSNEMKQEWLGLLVVIVGVAAMVLNRFAA